MIKTYYQVVTTQTFESYGKNHTNLEEAKKELDQEIKSAKFKPHFSFRIQKVYYENCEPEEFDQLLGPNPKKNAE